MGSKIVAVLVVEDNVVERLSVAASLHEAGFTVLQARDAAEALDVLGSVTPVDMVFSDVQMPGALNGFGLAEWIERNRADVKVILTSGRVRRGDPDLGSYAGPFISKPYDPDIVPEQIRKLV